MQIREVCKFTNKIAEKAEKVDLEINKEKYKFVVKEVEVSNKR